MNQSELLSALAQSFVVGIQGPRAQADELSLFAQKGLGGVILFARNVQNTEQIWALNSNLRQAAQQAGRPPLLVMVDQEGGSVARLKGPFTHGPDFSELGLAGDSSQVFAHGARMGRELVAAGFNWDLAPVLDVHAMEDGVMQKRSLGSDPARVAELGAAFIQGLQSTGCLACAKHFPGLGRTTLDTHKHKPLVYLAKSELKSLELIPFQRAVSENVAGIMVCHAVFHDLDPDSPADLSPKVVQGLLRQEMGYKGLILSDDLEMAAVSASLDTAQAAVNAYVAGCDLLLICHHPEFALKALDTLVKMAGDGQISPQRVQDTWSRIMAVKQGLNPLPGTLAELNGLLNPSA